MKKVLSNNWGIITAVLLGAYLYSVPQAEFNGFHMIAVMFLFILPACKN